MKNVDKSTYFTFFLYDRLKLFLVINSDVFIIKRRKKLKTLKLKILTRIKSEKLYIYASLNSAAFREI